MLTNLKIQNFGLIDEVSIDFGPALNVLTGSTGAGKSIIIDGIRFALGERLNPSQIRDKEAPCTVEAAFFLPSKFLSVHDLFKEFVNSEDGLLIIRREYLPDGRTRVKVNGMNITVAQLKALGDRLVDLHGPHDHQMLLSDEYHLPMLDQLVDFGEAREAYSREFKEYLRLTAQLNELKSMADSRDRDMDLLNHQIRELEQVSLKDEDYEALVFEQNRIRNAERLFEHASSLMQCLDDEDGGVNENIRKACGHAQQLAGIDQQAQEFTALLEQAQELCAEISSQARDYLESLSFEPGTAEEVARKYDCYDDIKRKYGPEISQAKAFLEDAKKKYALLVDYEQNDHELQNEIQQVRGRLKDLASKLSEKRKRAAKALKTTIERELKDLGIEHVNFEVRFKQVDFIQSGADEVVFFISPNAGEELKPLSQIVSSGEAARMMLALKRALTEVDPIPVLVFDEIDAQIGGRLGTITGSKLQELASGRQVILITHLPQIAAFGKQHFKVIKRIINKRTVTEVLPLNGQDRLEELAQMMDGEKQTKLSLEHARDMLESAQKA
ncbi:MAG TPA: DNA repair protein RecN [Candidatus Omnitrophota bacterium]|nr:DNA repair protein RecN [Candidatus Omnitrophota bacterium]